MKAPLFGRIAILGTGLIGGSLAAAIKTHNVAVHVAAYDVAPEALHFLEKKQFIHSAHANPVDAVKDADIIIFAAPPEALAAISADIAPHLKPKAIVTDVTSIKRKAIGAITNNLPPHVTYIPGHPIAGSQYSGAPNSNPELFAGHRVILTPTEEQVLSEPVSQVRLLWESLGAQVEYMPPDMHDRIYAYVSHLPQIAAFATRPNVPEGNADPACAGVLRLAQSPPALWADICFANADFIHEALEEFSIFLSQMSQELTENAEEGVLDNEGEALAPGLACAVVALCLVATALLLEQRTGARVSQYGGPGFRDMTAAAGKHSDSVLGAISNHPQAVAKLLGDTFNRLHSIGAALSIGNKEGLVKAFTS